MPDTTITVDCNVTQSRSAEHGTKRPVHLLVEWRTYDNIGGHTDHAKRVKLTRAAVERVAYDLLAAAAASEALEPVPEPERPEKETTR